MTVSKFGTLSGSANLSHNERWQMEQDQVCEVCGDRHTQAEIDDLDRRAQEARRQAEQLPPSHQEWLWSSISEDLAEIHSQSGGHFCPGDIEKVEIRYCRKAINDYESELAVGDARLNSDCPF